MDLTGYSPLSGHHNQFSGGSRPSIFRPNPHRPFDNHRPSNFDNDDDRLFPNTRPPSILRPHRPRPFPPTRPPPHEHDFDFKRPHNTFTSRPHHPNAFDTRPFERPGPGRPPPPFVSTGPEGAFVDQRGTNCCLASPLAPALSKRFLCAALKRPSRALSGTQPSLEGCVVSCAKCCSYGVEKVVISPLMPLSALRSSPNGVSLRM